MGSSPRRSSRSATRCTSRWWPRASRPTPRCASCAATAATKCRGSSTASRCRQRRTASSSRKPSERSGNEMVLGSEARGAAAARAAEVHGLYRRSRCEQRQVPGGVGFHKASQRSAGPGAPRAGGIHFPGVSEKARPVVLVVDDSTDMLALMERALSADYEIITASDPGAAIEKAFGEPRPDLILLDVEMPEISGFEVCRALKDEPTTASIPIIFLTGKTEAQAQVEGLELGAAD